MFLYSSSAPKLVSSKSEKANLRFTPSHCNQLQCKPILLATIFLEYYIWIPFQVAKLSSCLMQILSASFKQTHVIENWKSWHEIVHKYWGHALKRCLCVRWEYKNIEILFILCHFFSAVQDYNYSFTFNATIYFYTDIYYFYFWPFSSSNNLYCVCVFIYIIYTATQKFGISKIF